MQDDKGFPVPPKPEKGSEGTPNEPEQKSEIDPEVEQSKIKVDVPDKLNQPLEVEEMSESQELKERREQMRSKLTESVLISDGKGDDAGLLEETSSGGLSEILADANLSPRHLRFCCGGILIFALLVGITFGAVTLVKRIGDAEPKPQKDNEVIDEIPDDEIDIEDKLLDDHLDGSIEGGLFVGMDIGELDVATIAGEIIGTQSTSAQGYTKYVLDFKEMFELYKVDVPQLLDQSRDRTKTLDEYLNQIKFSSFLAKENLKDLQDEDDAIIRRFEAVDSAKQDSEDEFFTRLNQLDAFGSQSFLNAFIDQSKLSVELKAEHQARLKLMTFYRDIIPELDRKAKAIELNREALIKGIKVVDVDGTDIDLIIDESEL